MSTSTPDPRDARRVTLAVAAIGLVGAWQLAERRRRMQREERAILAAVDRLRDVRKETPA